MVISSRPTLALTFNPPGPTFSISEDCVMPSITATATIYGLPVGFKDALVYNWTATLVFNGKSCLHSAGRVTSHPPMSQTSTSNVFNVTFAKVRGGDLTISVSVQVGKDTVVATSTNLQVTGTNPSVAKLAVVVPQNPTFRRIMRLESQLKQFLSPTCPLFNSLDDGGAGICQVTPPSDDDVWSWKSNVTAGYKIYQNKEKIARNYPGRVQNMSGFTDLVRAFNAARLAPKPPAAPGLPLPGGGGMAPVPTPLTVKVPEFTADQLQLDVIRGYNGWAGSYLGHELHEFWLQVDANGILVVSEDANGTSGAAVWERVPANKRPMNGDYVDVVMNNYQPF